MPKNRKHISHNDFQRYLENRMTDAERNAFERELQKHPFEAEALEGLQQFPAREIQDDLNALSQKISQKNKHRKTRYWAAAATLLLLVSVGVIWFQLNEESPVPEMAETKTIQEQQERNSPEKQKDSENPLTKTEEKRTEISEQEKQEAKKTAPVSEKEVEKTADAATGKTQSMEAETISEPPMAAAAKTPETNQLAEKAGEAVPASDTQMHIRGVATFRSSGTEKGEERLRFVQTSDLIESGQKTVRGKVISQDDSLPIAGATIVEKGSLNGTVSDMDGNFSLQLTNENDSTLVASFVGMQNTEFNPSGDSLVVVALQPSEMAQNEMVVIGYGTIGENKKEQTIQNAQPVGGMDNFEKYLKENAILPENYPSKRVVAKVQLHLNSAGEIIKIKNINNTGRELFEKTKQIILNGPDWVPEMKNGKNTASETELRIVFKKAK